MILPRGPAEERLLVVALVIHVLVLLRKGPVALLVADHGEEARGDSDPVQVVGDDGADRGGVLPAEDGVEDSPEAAAVEIGVAALLCVSMLIREEAVRNHLTFTCQTLLRMS